MPVKGSRKTHCKHGHEFTPENTALYRDGSRRCRTCERGKNRKYSLLNRGRIRERLREWRLKNPERVRESRRKSDLKHPERKRERLRKWRLKNPERDRQRMLKWRLENPERMREMQMEWRKKAKIPCPVCGHSIKYTSTLCRECRNLLQFMLGKRGGASKREMQASVSELKDKQLQGDYRWLKKKYQKLKQARRLLKQKTEFLASGA